MKSDPSVIQIFVLNCGKELTLAKKDAKDFVTVESHNQPHITPKSRKKKILKVNLSKNCRK